MTFRQRTLHLLPPKWKQMCVQIFLPNQSAQEEAGPQVYNTSGKFSKWRVNNYSKRPFLFSLWKENQDLMEGLKQDFGQTKM